MRAEEAGILYMQAATTAGYDGNYVHSQCHLYATQELIIQKRN